jgi:ProP effector
VGDRVRSVRGLSQRWPKCFVWFEDKRRPLKRRIHEDILASGLAVEPHELGHVLSAYTCNAKYRTRLVEGTERIDLNGEPAGTVTFEEQLRAQELNATFYAKARRRQKGAVQKSTAVATKPGGEIAAHNTAKPARPEEAKASPPHGRETAKPHPWPVLKLRAFR